MKLAVKTAWMGGAGLCLLVTYTSVFRQMDIMDLLMGKQLLLDPITAMLLSGGAGLVGGSLGYFIGDTLSRPKGRKKPRKGRAPNHSTRLKKEEVSTPITGDETFLDDLESVTPPPVEAYAPEQEEASRQPVEPQAP